jgi:hypothetical protein
MVVKTSGINEITTAGLGSEKAGVGGSIPPHFCFCQARHKRLTQTLLTWTATTTLALEAKRAAGWLGQHRDCVGSRSAA